MRPCLSLQLLGEAAERSSNQLPQVHADPRKQPAQRNQRNQREWNANERIDYRQHTP